MVELESKLAKRGSTDLAKKLENVKTTQDEKAAIRVILKRRGVLKEEAPKSEKQTRKPNPNIESELVKVGDSVVIPDMSHAALPEEGPRPTVTGEVIKVYKCNRSGKEYARIKANGRIYHKRVAYFQTAE